MSPKVLSLKKPLDATRGMPSQEQPFYLDTFMPHVEAMPDMLAALDNMSRVLRYTELQEHDELRKHFIQAARAGDLKGRKKSMAAYQDAVCPEIDWIADPDVHLGFLVACAHVRLEAGLVQDCVDDLREIYDAARYTGFDAIADEIKYVIESLAE